MMDLVKGLKRREFLGVAAGAYAAMGAAAGTPAELSAARGNGFNHRDADWRLWFKRAGFLNPGTVFDADGVAWKVLTSEPIAGCRVNRYACSAARANAHTLPPWQLPDFYRDIKPRSWMLVYCRV